MLWLVLALSLSGGVAVRSSTEIATTSPQQLTEGSVGIPPRTVAEGSVGIPPRNVAEGSVGIPRNVAESVGIPPVRSRRLGRNPAPQCG